MIPVSKEFITEDVFFKWVLAGVLAFRASVVLGSPTSFAPSPLSRIILDIGKPVRHRQLKPSEFCRMIEKYVASVDTGAVSLCPVTRMESRFRFSFFSRFI